MSLVSSLFDIMVQQWLREYRTPTNSSVREAVRLRETRAFRLGLVEILPEQDNLRAEAGDVAHLDGRGRLGHHDRAWYTQPRP